jgi:plastocyanin
LYGRLLVIGAIALVSAFLIACSSGDDDGDENGAAPSTSGDTGTQASQQVSIVDFAYEPAEIDATANQELTIELANHGELPHTFTIDGLVDSREVAPGESAMISFTPAEAGTLTFFCTVHGAGTMSGELTVN